MSFFVNNKVIEFFQRLSRRPSAGIMWLFTGVIVTGTAYLMLFLPGVPRDITVDQDEELQELVEIE
ncbi:hypothetical protein NCAS_0A14860 [Naumovozyma castellii]|uniref:Uncharacterized protein n=1 Tax=Naumovozyma castellii TaxID=27288 RepID=G0V993_NAUCA|nr:hypothetical protein NCAS_0A14860 [Naumovozyma castellii CBS 4309]CCC68044.1 hypothetical protein NCAS_0A14860 [Naumovozyma castellii CBS 4309]